MLNKVLGLQLSGEPGLQQRLLVTFEHFQGERRAVTGGKDRFEEFELERVGRGIVVFLADHNHLGGVRAVDEVVPSHAFTGRPVEDRKRAGIRRGRRVLRTRRATRRENGRQQQEGGDRATDDEPNVRPSD